MDVHRSEVVVLEPHNQAPSPAKRTMQQHLLFGTFTLQQRAHSSNICKPAAQAIQQCGAVYGEGPCMVGTCAQCGPLRLILRARDLWPWPFSITKLRVEGFLSSPLGSFLWGQMAVWQMVVWPLKKIPVFLTHFTCGT